MLQRILEPEVMDSESEARDYDSMDHREVNARFVVDLLAHRPDVSEVLDLGTGTAQIPIELCRVEPRARVLAVDLAEWMLALGRENVARMGYAHRICLERVDAKGLPYAAGRFSAVISNSIIHHIPDPRAVLAEMVRVTAPGGLIFVRDLLRPEDQATLTHLVQTYAGDANAHQRQMFDDSLHAALSLDEIRGLVAEVGYLPQSVQQTTDRHWTWVARRHQG
jgi:ubiquinone/menaquinone biosynthesis C-methylase UbiE